MSAVDIYGYGDAEIVENAQHGKQSKLPYAFELIPAAPLFEVAEAMKYGEERYGEGNYLRISERVHIGRAISHLYALLAGDQSEFHAAHAICRILMSMEVARNKQAEAEIE